MSLIFGLALLCGSVFMQRVRVPLALSLVIDAFLKRVTPQSVSTFKGLRLLAIIVFTIVLFCNIRGLLRFVFTPRSQMSFSLRLALPL